MNRRHFLTALAGGAALAGGCQRRQPVHPKAPMDESSTIVSPARAAASPRLTSQPLQFTDVSRDAGIHWGFNNGATGLHLFIETTGGGVAFFDYNNDGLLDIFAVQGGPEPGASGAARRFSTRNVLYRNNGDGTFTDVTSGSGLDVYTGYGQGVSVADYDNDGWPDLYVTSYGGSHLFHNNRDGAFKDVTTRAGVADRAAERPWPLSSAWADYDNDGRLDLFVCHYARWSLALNKDCRAPGNRRSYCRPQVYESSHCKLYHNNGDGTFTDVTKRAGLASLAGKNMGAAWIDYDDDGWMDLFVTNDTLPNFLLHNNRDGTFTDRGLVSGAALGASGTPDSGMGIGVGDYDNDGREDLIVVNFAGEPKSIYQNRGSGEFENQSYASNIASTNLQYLGFGLECFDYDLDGYKDIIVGNGHVLDDPESLGGGATYAQSQQLFHNQRSGTFALDLRSLGDLVKPRVTRGLAVGDYDNDGDLDVVMVAQNGPLQLFRNDGGNRNNWITFRLEGVHSCRDAVGAKVTIRTKELKQMQRVRGGSSYCSHSDTRITFGLGQEAGIEAVEIRWPRGRVQRFGPLPGRQFYWIREGSEPVPDPRVARRKEPYAR
ncbi:MAG TPA: CRTAC1 family protein [Armatimonadota bacterium]|nr:CRTAC1 family protein [Armatimonadota bacterium]